MSLILDYLGHSGFLAETNRCLLLFDYYRGDLFPLLEKKPLEKPLYVFASHVHPDHFNPEIFSLIKSPRAVSYLLSSDIRTQCSVPSGTDIRFLDPDQTCTVPGLGMVRTLRSTDQGVAFLIDSGNVSLFHAGDLNWWNWEGEDPEWLADQERVYKQEIEKLSGIQLDAAFVVLDGRLGDRFADGMNWFLSVCSPDYVLPMHFWEDRDVIERFRSLSGRISPKTRILDTARENHWEL